MKLNKQVFIVILFVLAVLAPFINKPFNVDDPFYIKMAQHIILDPLRPYSFSINWSGELRDVWGKTEATFPPLIVYYLAFVIKVFGAREWILHLFFMIFPVTAALSLYYLIKKYCQNPFLLTLTAVSAPAFLISSTSIMLDIPLAAFMLASAAFFVYGIDGENDNYILVSFVLAGLAILVKYSGMLLIPLYAAELIFRNKTRYLRYLAIPALFLGLWCLHNILIYGGIHFLRGSRQVGGGVSLHKLIAAPLFFSGAMIFPMFAYISANRKEFYAALVLSVLLFGFSYIVIGGIGTSILFSLFFGSALFFAYKTIINYLSIERFVLIWFALAAALVLCVEPWVSGRYMLIMLAPSIIIAGKLMEKRYALLFACITLVFGLVLSSADYQWARAYSGFSEYAASRGFTPGYFTGHFGFQYYMEKKGFSALEINKPPAGPAYLIVPRYPDAQKPGRELLGRIEFIEYRKVDSVFPLLRVMDPKSHAGFYSSFWGILPFNFSRNPLDEFLVYKIRQAG